VEMKSATMSMRSSGLIEEKRNHRLQEGRSAPQRPGIGAWRVRMLWPLLTVALGVSAADPGRFRVCADPVNPPLSTREGTGLENRIAELFAQELGLELTYTWFPQRMGFIRNTLKAKDEETGEYRCDVVMGVPAGYDMVATTKPYYRSTYVLLIKRGEGFDQIEAPEDLERLDYPAKSRLKIAVFPPTPGVDWVARRGLMEYAEPYQPMTGDPNENTAMRLERIFTRDGVNMAVVWGPLAAYLVKKNPHRYRMIPLKSEPGLRLDFAMAMGVRHGDEELKALLNRLIDEKREEILAILQEYRVPLVDRNGEPIRRRGNSAR